MADRYDLADFDSTQHDLDAARAINDAAAFQAFMSETSAALTALRADLATRRVTDLEQAQRVAEQHRAILDRLVDPKTIALAAIGGAERGVTLTFETLVTDLTAALKVDADAHIAATREANARLNTLLHAAADRQSQAIDHINRTEQARQSLAERFNRTWIAGGALIALLVLLAGSLGYWQGSSVGQANGYADARDEVAAASWAGTQDGKRARKLDRINPGLLDKLLDCTGQGWTKHRSNGRKACYPGSGPGVEAWWREKP